MRKYAVRGLFGAAPLLCLILASAQAQEDAITPLELPVGQSVFTLGGTASGAGFVNGKTVDATGVAQGLAALTRSYDSGLSISGHLTASLADPLARGRYDGDVWEEAYGEVRTGLGAFRMGMTDGAGALLPVGSPRAAEDVSLSDPRIFLFRDPTNDKPVAQIFALTTQVGTSSNSAKLIYQSPNLFGVELALAFSPGEGKDVLPFLRAGPHVPGRQADIWETSARYSFQMEEANVSLYAALAEGRAEHKLPGQEGVSDIGAGAKIDYPVNDDVTVSLGGSWRQSNAYAFDIHNAWQAATTNAYEMGVGASWGAWMASAQYGAGFAGGVTGAGLAHMNLEGAELALSRNITPNLTLAIGWQRFDYARAAGTFYNGSPRLLLDAGFLHFKLHV